MPTFFHTKGVVSTAWHCQCGKLDMFAIVRSLLQVPMLIQHANMTTVTISTWCPAAVTGIAGLSALPRCNAELGGSAWGGGQGVPSG